MPKTKMDLSRGGWTGWTFGPYGKAREWRLFAPDGTTYTQGELRELRALALDVDYLRMRVRELEEQTAGAAVRLTADELGTLRQAAAIMEKKLPRAPARLRTFQTSQANIDSGPLRLIRAR